MDWLPDLERDAHGRDLAWSSTKNPKGVLHTTESSGWPGYRDWTVHPHATIMPIPGKGIRGKQHVPFSRASFALRNEAGGVQTNTDYAFQFELIGTSEKGGPGYYWPGADDAVLLDLYRKVIHPLSQARGIPETAARFQGYPESYGARSGTNDVRMSGATWDDYAGWCGHQHVPENVHGDPGAFPWDRMIRLAEEDDMALSADDKKWLSAEMDRRINAGWERFLDTPAIDNLPASPGEVQGTDWRPRRLLANADLKLDRIIIALGKLTGGTPPDPAAKPSAGQ